MTYDFTTVTDRQPTWSSKWDVAPGELPMSTADMDFVTAPEIQRALRRRLETGVYGYTDVPEAWYDACVRWWKTRHGFTLEKDWLIFSAGVVPTISSCVRKLSTPAEKVLLLTPVYNIFFNSIVNNGRFPLECPLRYMGDRYKIDWEALEAGLRDPQTRLMLLCNPHNPTGQIWSRETLARIGALCRECGVTVISDEIHCDLTDPGLAYVPFASVDETCASVCVMAMAPSKSFSIPGLQTSAVAVPDPLLRHQVWRALNTDEVAEPNAFAVDAAIAAWTEGEGWLDAARAQLAANKARVRAFVAEEIPAIRVLPSEATYLLWLDVSALTEDSALLAAHLRRETGLILSAGAVYRGDGARFLRMNTAYPPAQLEDGLARLKRGVRSFPSAV